MVEQTVCAGAVSGGASPAFYGGIFVKKIAFTTTGKDLQAAMDPRFGRAPGFLVFDVDQESIQSIENQQARNASQGAGIQAAETIVRAGVDTLVTGHCGPKAFRVLDAAGVKVYNCDAATVAEALELLRAGKLTVATVADVEGHW